MAEAGSILGNAVVRLEDPTLVTGTGQYVDDLEAADAARVVFVRSSLAPTSLEPEGWTLRVGVPGFRQVSCVKRPIEGALPDDREPGVPAAKERASTPVLLWSLLAR